MALTRAEVETVLVRRTKGFLQRAGMSVLTSGSNPDLNDPLASALVYFGASAASRAAVTDADLLVVTTAHPDAYLDVAEVMTLRSLWGNLKGVNVKVGPRSENLSDLRKDLLEYLEAREKQVQQTWGAFLDPPLISATGEVILPATIRAL